MGQFRSGETEGKFGCMAKRDGAGICRNQPHRRRDSKLHANPHARQGGASAVCLRGIRPMDSALSE